MEPKILNRDNKINNIYIEGKGTPLVPVVGGSKNQGSFGKMAVFGRTTGQGAGPRFKPIWWVSGGK